MPVSDVLEALLWHCIQSLISSGDVLYDLRYPALLIFPIWGAGSSDREEMSARMPIVCYFCPASSQHRRHWGRVPCMWRLSEGLCGCHHGILWH